MNFLYKNSKSYTSELEFTTSCKFSKVIKTFTLLALLLVVGNAKAATITSTATGGLWSATSTWVGGVVPLASDNVIIATTGTSSVDVQSNITQTGSVTVINGAIFASTTGATVTIGSLVVDSGGVVNMNRNLTVTGSTSISGTINFASSSGTARVMTFSGDVTLNSGSVWTEPSTGNGVNNTYVFSGNFTNNATTFNALGTGSHTFNGASKTLSGSTVTSIPVIIVSGTITNNLAISVGTSFTINNGATLQMGTGASPTILSGAGTFVLSAGATLGITSAGGISTSGATGNIQNSGTRTYTAGANYIYNGSSNQVTGNGLSQNSPASVQINNSGNNVTFSAALTISGNLSIGIGSIVNLGTFSSTSATLTLGGTSQTAGGMTYGGTGTSGTITNTTYFAAASGKVTVGAACTAGVWVGTTSTDWNTASNWCNGILPTASTTVTINSGGNQPTISSSAFCNSITIGSGATLTISATGTLAVSGAITKTGTLTLATGSTINYAAAGAQTVLDVAYSNLTISGSGIKTQTLGASRSISGNLIISSGATFTLGGTNTRTFTVSGTTDITGTFNLGTTTATKTFTGNVTINSGGVWNEGGAAAYNFGGNLVNNATTFTASTGTHTFTGAAKSFSGATATSIPTVAITGSYTNFGTLTISTALSGAGSLTQDTNSILNIGGTSTITTFSAIAVGNTVNYNGAAQTVLVTTYNNLTLSGTGAKTFTTGTTTVNGALSIENGTNANTFTGSLAYGTDATLQYNAGSSARTVASEWPANFTSSGGVLIKGTGIITLNAAKVLGANTNVPLNITSGAKLTTGNFGLTFNGDFTNAGTFTAGSSPIIITGTTATQYIAGFTTTGALSMTKSSGTANITSSVSAAAFTVNGTSGVLNLGTSLTHTFTGDITLTAGTLNGGALTTINANSSTATAWNGSGSVFVPGTSTVVFGGTNQTLGTSSPSFYNVTFSGTSATKTITNSLTVANNLNINTSAKLSLANGTSSTTKILQFNSTSQVGGSYGFTGSGATNINTTYFTGGTGILNSSTANRFVITGSATQIAGATQSLTITALDAAGNTLTSYTGDKSLTFSGASVSPNNTTPKISNNSGSLIAFGSPTLITFTNGIATVTSSNNGVMALYKNEVAVISASDGTITSTGSDRLFVTVSSSASRSLVFTTQPNGGNTNTIWTSQPVVTWQDTYGNPVTGTANNVTLSIANNPSSGTLNGTKTVALNTISGIATFSGLTIDKSGTGYTLTATPTTGTPATSASFDISNPAPTLSSISPSTVCSGGVGFTLSLSGSNFNAASVVKINGAVRTTTFEDSANITAEILASDIANGGTPSITVYTPTPGGGTSSGVTLTIVQPSLNSTISQPSCFSDGSITLSPAGGTSPYTYDWADLSGTSNPKDRSGLLPGNYSVLVTDANGCFSNSGTITMNAASNCTGITVCKSDTTSILSVPPDPNDTSYTWTLPSGAIGTSTTNTISINWTGVAVGAYSVSVVGNNSCGTSSASTIIVYVQEPTASASADLACSGDNLNLYASGGVSYSWSGPNSFTSQSANPVIYNISSAQAGTYTVSVTNAAGCTKTASVSVTVNTPPTIVDGSITQSTTGNAIGAIPITVSGGTSYTYLWTAESSAFSSTSQNLTGLYADNYTVIVTNQTGCTASKTYTVSNSDGPSATATPTNSTCNGSNNGSILLSTPTGTGPFTYSWSGPNNYSSTIQSPTGLAPGTYTVVITDTSNNAIGVATATIDEPSAIQANGIVTNINCNAATTGAIALTVSGGTSTYTYAWTGPNSFTATTKDISSLSAGTYTVTITDINSCTLTQSFTIQQPSAGISATASITNVTCYGESNGQAVLTVNGGTSPYTYAWNGTSFTATTKDISTRPAGTYSVLITDSKGCTFSLTSGTAVVITQPSAALSLSTSSTNVTCKGTATGSVTLSTSGGTSPYSYSWSNGVTTKDLSNLAAGTYTVVVTDANGCTATTSVTITQPAANLSASNAVTNISCNGGNTGAINLSPTGGTTPYTYLWSTNATTEDISTLSAGTYSVVITDANGCTANSSATLTQPSAITVSGSVTNVLCNGSSTGAIAISVSGGTGSYTYDWGSGITTQNRTNLAAGTYTVTVMDANSCSSEATSFVITQSPVLTLSTVKKNISCKSESNGGISLSVTGGTYPYTYAWTGSNGYTATSQNIDNIPAGTYAITVTDSNSCTASESGIVLTEPASAISLLATPTAVTCQGGSNGSITAIASGGTTPYSYAWSTGATTATVTGLSKGAYSVLITDANGCTSNQNVNVSEPSNKLELYTNVKASSSCGTATGSIELSVVNGNAPFSYSWTNTSQTTSNPTALAAGTYTATVTDTTGCSATISATVSTAPSLSSTITTYPKTCLYNDGSAYAIVSGGVAPYTFSWSNGATSQNIGLLDSGSVSVTITDANGCTNSSTGTVGSISCLAPIAVNDTFTTNYQTTFTGTVANGDSDPDALDQDHPNLQYFSTQNPTPAQGVLNWGTDYDGSFTFVPAAGFSGTFTLTYMVFDTTGLSSIGTYTITVGPNAVDDALGTPLNTQLDSNVHSNDFYANGSIFSKLSDPSHGTVIFNSDGTFVYTPTTDYAGDDSFTYKICLPDPNQSICSNTATVLISVDGSADVAINKTISNATPNVGANVVFTLTATNNGPNFAIGVNVEDTLPTGYTYVSNTTSIGSFDSSTGIWSVGGLANAATATLQITATVNPTGNYTNTASITSQSTDPGSSNNSSSVSAIPVPQSDISIVGSVSNASQNIGSSVTFTLTVSNNGPNDATGVMVSDLLPSGYTYTSSSPGVGTYNPSTGVWTIGDLTNGSSVTLTITAIVNTTNNYTNTAVVSSTTNDPNTTNNSASQVVTPGAVSNLSLTKTINNANPYVGGLVEFTLTATNNGPSNATGVSVTDSLPSGYTYDSDSGNGAYIPSTGIWTIGNLNNGSTRVLKIYAIVKATGNYTNSASINSTDQPDSDPSNNNPSVAPTSVVSQADLSIVKTVNTNQAVIGNNVIFTLAVTNNGPSDATGVSVSDLLPSGYTYVSSSTSSGTYTSGTGIWAVGSIPNGATKTIAITVTVNSTGDYINVASVNATTTDLTTGNNTSSKTVTPIPLLVVNNPAAVCYPATVDITANAITAGSSANLTYTYWNDGNTTSPYATPTQATNGTYYIKASTSTGNFTVEPVFVIVNPVSVAGTISGASSVCSGTNSTVLTLSGYTGTIQWQSSNSLSGTYSDIIGATASTYVATNLTATTYYKAVVTSGVCTSSISSVHTLTVYTPVTAGSISGAGTVCSATTNSTVLTLNGSVGAIQWQSSNTLTGTYTNIIGATSNTYTATNLSANTYFRAVISNGSCTSANTASVLITVLSSNIWTGSVSTEWNNASNWSCGVPGSGENIEVPGGLSNYPILDGPRTIGNIILASGATVNLNNSTLTILGVITGTGTIIGSTTSSLTINGSGNQGTFYMNQATPGTSNIVGNFTLNSTASGSATLGNNMGISGILTLTNGTFNTGGYLTLMSNGTTTAVVAPISDCSAVAINGDVTVERFFPARRAFRFISSPVTTTTTIRDNLQEGVNNPPPAYVTNLNPHPGYGTHITGNITGNYGFDITQTTNNSMFTFNNTSGVWAAVPNTNAITLTAGVPYRLLIRGDRSISMSTNAPTPTNTTLRAKGALKICDASAGTISPTANGYNFIGNPYQATVDIKQVLTENAHFNNNYYWVWDPKINVRGGYVAYDLSTGINPVSGSQVNQYLQPWQACFVKNDATAGGTIIFHESNKSVSVVNENIYRATATIPAYIRATLYESNTLATSGVAADGLVIKFDSSYDNLVDSNDAPKLANQDEIFATKNNTSLLGIESRIFPVDTDVIPINITQYRNTNYTIVAQGNNMSGLPAYLHDQLLQTYTEIPQSGSVSYSYSISTTDTATSASDRFRIVFQNPNLSTTTNSNLIFTMYPNPSKQGVFDVVMNNATEDTKLSIYNSIGQEVYSTYMTSSTINHINPNKVFATGVYYVKIAKEGETTIKKLIIE